MQPFSVYVRIRPVDSVFLKNNKRSSGNQKSLRVPMKIRGQSSQILQIFQNTENYFTQYMQNQTAIQHAYESNIQLNNIIKENNEPNSEQHQSYLFDKVFGEDQNNLDIFQAVLQQLIPQLLEGYNVSCFAYGMTGSGKTHTMLGYSNSPLESDESQRSPTGQKNLQLSDQQKFEQLKNLGLCNLAIQNLFFQMFQKKDESDYTVKVSYLEIYNEQVFDLLADLRECQMTSDNEDVQKSISNSHTFRNYVKSLIGQQDPDQYSKQNIQNEQSSTFYNNSNQKISKTAHRKNLKIVEDPMKGVVVQNLQEISVQDSTELMELIQLGNQRRFVANTGANKFSSRSHAILIFNIEGNQILENGDKKTIRSKLQIIDLAGSERAANTDNKGQRMVEGANINRSLLALGQCINILADQSQKNLNKLQKQRSLSKHIGGNIPQLNLNNQNLSSEPYSSVSTPKQQHIPYRDSKLTRLLKDSLGGSTKTVMIACISQLAQYYDETLNTIKYACKAKSIQNQKVKNEIIQKEYRREEMEQQALFLKQQQQEMQRILDIKNEEEKESQRQIQLRQIDLVKNENVKIINLNQLKKQIPEPSQDMQIQRKKDEVIEILQQKLIPNIVRQYNLKHQIESNKVMMDFHNENHEQFQKLQQSIFDLQQQLKLSQSEQNQIQTFLTQLIQNSNEEQLDKIQIMEQIIAKKDKKIKKIEKMLKEQENQNIENFRNYQQENQNLQQQIQIYQQKQDQSLDIQILEKIIDDKNYEVEQLKVQMEEKVKLIHKMEQDQKNHQNIKELNFFKFDDKSDKDYNNNNKKRREEPGSEHQALTKQKYMKSIKKANTLKRYLSSLKLADNPEQSIIKNSYDKQNNIILDHQSNHIDFQIKSTQIECNQEFIQDNNSKITQKVKKSVQLDLNNSQLPYEEIELLENRINTMPVEKSVVNHYEQKAHSQNREDNKSQEFDENSKIFQVENELNINSLNYPKLRQSLNNSRFQNNLRPKSNNSRFSGSKYQNMISYDDRSRSNMSSNQNRNLKFENKIFEQQPKAQLLNYYEMKNQIQKQSNGTFQVFQKNKLLNDNTDSFTFQQDISERPTIDIQALKESQYKLRVSQTQQNPFQTIYSIKLVKNKIQSSPQKFINPQNEKVPVDQIQIGKIQNNFQIQKERDFSPIKLRGLGHMFSQREIKTQNNFVNIDQKLLQKSSLNKLGKTYLQNQSIGQNVNKKQVKMNFEYQGTENLHQKELQTQKKQESNNQMNYYENHLKSVDQLMKNQERINNSDITNSFSQNPFQNINSLESENLNANLSSQEYTPAKQDQIKQSILQQSTVQKQDLTNQKVITPKLKFQKQNHNNQSMAQIIANSSQALKIRKTQQVQLADEENKCQSMQQAFKTMQNSNSKNDLIKNTVGQRYREMLSLAEVRKFSKKRKIQHDAIKDLALNFNKLKNAHLVSQKQLDTQMLIVDSIEQQLTVRKKSKRQNMRSPIIKNLDECVDADLTDSHRSQEESNINNYQKLESQKEILKVKSHFSNKDSECYQSNHQQKMQRFVNENTRKMEEIQKIAETIEMRSVERSQSRYRELSIGKNERQKFINRSSSITNICLSNQNDDIQNEYFFNAKDFHHQSVMLKKNLNHQINQDEKDSFIIQNASLINDQLLFENNIKLSGLSFIKEKLRVPQKYIQKQLKDEFQNI